MRDADRKDDITGTTGTAIIRRMRARRRLSFGSGDTIEFDVAAYKLDRELGIAEFIAVENNIRIVSRWPEVILESS